MGLNPKLQKVVGRDRKGVWRETLLVGGCFPGCWKFLWEWDSGGHVCLQASGRVRKQKACHAYLGAPNNGDWTTCRTRARVVVCVRYLKIER